MPGGICATETRAEFFNESAVRCAEVVMRIGGLRFKAFLAGAAKASFPTKTEAELASLALPEEFAVEWESAVFHGYRPLLGKITARLIADQLPQNPSFVHSQGLGAPPASPPSQTFFPALNRNRLPFQLEVPRLGLKYRSDEPVVNSALINAIPPVGSIYALENQPTFRAVPAMSSSPIARVSPSIRLESCRVKLMDLKGLDARLEVIAQTVETATFRLTISNKSSEDHVSITWLIWPEPEEGLDAASGNVSLGREPHSLEFTVPRNIFFLPRWIGVAIAEPFETDGAEAVQFPTLPNP